MSTVDARILLDKHLSGYHVGAEITDAYKVLQPGGGLLLNPSLKRTREEKTFVPRKQPRIKRTIQRPAFFEQVHTGAEWADALSATQRAALPRDQKYTEQSEAIVHAFNVSFFEKLFPARGAEIADNIQHMLRSSAETLASGTFDATLSPDERSERVRRGFKIFDNLKTATAYQIGGEKSVRHCIEVEALAGVDFFASTIVAEFNRENGPSTHFVSSYLKDKTFMVEAYTGMVKSRKRADRYDIPDLEFKTPDDAHEAIESMKTVMKHAAGKTPLPSFSFKLVESVLEKSGISRRFAGTPLNAKEDSKRVALLKFVTSLFLIAASWYTVYYFAIDFFDPTKNVAVIRDEANKMLNDVLTEQDLAETQKNKINDAIKVQHDALYNARTQRIDDFSVAQDLIQQHAVNAATLSGSVDAAELLKTQQTFIDEVVYEMTAKLNQYKDDVEVQQVRDALEKKHKQFNDALNRPSADINVDVAYDAMDKVLAITGGIFADDIKSTLKTAREFIATIEELTRRQVEWHKYAATLFTISTNARTALDKLDQAGNETPIYTGIFRFLAEHNVAQYFTGEKNAFGTHGVGNTFMSIFEQLGLDAFRQIECMWTRVIRDFSRISSNADAEPSTRILEYVHTLSAFGVNGTLRVLNNSWISWIVRFWAWGSTKTLQGLLTLSKRATRDLYLIMTGEPDVFVPVEEWISPYEFSYNFSQEAIDAFQQKIGAYFDLIYDTLEVFPATVKTIFNVIDTLQTISNYCIIVMQISITSIFQALFQGAAVALTTVGLVGVFLYVLYRFRGYNFLTHIVNFYVKHPNFRMLSIFLAQLITGGLVSLGFKKFDEIFYTPLNTEVNDILSSGGPFRAFIPKITPPFVVNF